MAVDPLHPARFVPCEAPALRRGPARASVLQSVLTSPVRAAEGKKRRKDEKRRLKKEAKAREKFTAGGGAVGFA